MRCAIVGYNVLHTDTGAVMKAVLTWEKVLATIIGAAGFLIYLIQVWPPEEWRWRIYFFIIYHDAIFFNFCCYNNNTTTNTTY